METVLIIGGTGLIGKYLCKALTDNGYNVKVLTRTRLKDTKYQTYTWDLNRSIVENEALKDVDYIINLAGANIGEKRWTKKRRQLILNSRVKSGQLIYEKIEESKNKIKAYISASAIGYYGMITSEKIFNESNPPSDDFLGKTCQKWEQSADEFRNLGIRTVKIRTGITLTKNDGAIKKMLIPIKLGIGSAIGSGSQYMPWIHIDDLCCIYIKAIQDQKMNGAYNAVAPDHRTNRDFTRTLAMVLKKPFWFPRIPSTIMKLFFGKMSSMLLNGSRVSSDNIRKAGYKFLFPHLNNALENLFINDDIRQK